ncbi:MAG: hypothetical protein ACYDDF_03615 [Thermoplasmatota archaeon]
MGKLSTIAISLATVTSALLLVAGTAAATSNPTVTADRTTFFETGETGHYQSANFTAAFTPASGDTVVATSWDFRDGSATQSGFGPVQHSYQNAGVYVVAFSVTTCTVCDGTDYHTWPGSVAVTVENAPPTGSSTPPSITAGQPLTVDFTLWDNQGIQSATLFYRHQGGTTFLSQAMSRQGSRNNQGQETWGYQIPASYLTAPIQYYASVTDVTGNASQAQTVRIPTGTTLYTATGNSNTPPTVTLDLSGTKAVPYGNGFPITIGLSSPNGIRNATFAYRKIGTTTYTQQAVNLVTDTAVIPWATSIAGTYNWYVSATDNSTSHNVGNVNSAGSPGTVTLSIGPKIVVNAPTTLVHQAPGTPLAFGANTTDDKAGVTTTLQYNAGAGWKTATVVAGADNAPGVNGATRSFIYTITFPTSAIGPSDIEYYLNATDSDSNVVSTGLAFFRASTTFTAPVITPVAPTVAVNKPVAIVATWSDPLSGVNASSVSVKIDGTAVPASQVNANATGFTIPANASAVTGLGESGHTVNVSVADGSGNVGTTQWTFILDKTPPTITNATPAGDVNMSTIQAHVADALSGVNAASLSLKVDGTAVSATYTAATGAIAASPNVGQGNHTVVLNVSDEAGNHASKTWTFLLDTVAPTITVTGANASISTGTPTIQVSFADSGSGIKANSWSFKVDGVAQTITATSTGFTFVPTTGLSSGSHTIVISVSDNAGNTASVTKTFTVSIPAPGSKGFLGLPGFEGLSALAALGVAAVVVYARRR